MIEQTIWRHCGTCKKPIGLNTKYYACSVSTCRKTAYCSVECFSDHVPVFRHKEAWAEERMSPKQLEEEAPEETAAAPLRRVVSPPAASGRDDLPKDILIVASKLKDYIRIKSGMNTSANVMERLSDFVRRHCDRAIEHAAREGRKTVMDRDFSL